MAAAERRQGAGGTQDFAAFRRWWNIKLPSSMRSEGDNVQTASTTDDADPRKKTIPRRPCSERA